MPVALSTRITNGSTVFIGVSPATATSASTVSSVATAAIQPRTLRTALGRLRSIEVPALRRLEVRRHLRFSAHADTVLACSVESLGRSGPGGCSGDRRATS